MLLHPWIERRWPESPRNQLNRHEEVARFWRPFRLLGSSQHRGQIPSQLNPELALLRRQDNRIDQPTQNLSGFPARVLAAAAR